MDSLPMDALQSVLGHLDYTDLLAASAASRLLRAAAPPDSPLWQRLCSRRWHGSLNAAFWPSQQEKQQQRDNYRATFLHDNGWAAPRLGVQRYAGSSWVDEIVALHPSTAPDGTTTIAVSSCRELRLLEVGPSPTAPLRTTRAGNITGGDGGPQELWSAVIALPGSGAGGEELVAAGGCYGRLALLRLPEARGGGPCTVAVQPSATLAFPNNSCIISQLHALGPARQRLAVLHDALAHLRATPQRSQLTVMDVASCRQVAPALHDVLDGYELAAAAPLGPGGDELVAGSVRLSDEQASGWPCRRCHPAAPAALCFHKSRASCAALCMLDLRAPQPMVARYVSHHRSLHPNLETVRDHYVLTSHANTPVAVWDRRHMNAPVHEAAPLPSELDPSLAASGWLPLDTPDDHERPASQALHLSATPDLLLGRADNGMLWLFDLSERLGWRDGSHGGSWLRQARRHRRRGAAGDAAGGEHDLEDAWEEDHLDECDFQRGPLPLGVLGAPFEVWASMEGEAPPLHWLPPTGAWVAHNRLVALEGLELEDKQALFPAFAQGNPYPSNCLAVASLLPQR